MLRIILFTSLVKENAISRSVIVSYILKIDKIQVIKLYASNQIRRRDKS